MAYQLLQGIRVTPKGTYNLGRFSKSIGADGKWPNSFAFGGWIYNSTCDIGFSHQPTDIKLSIVLEVVDMAQKYAFFDIKDADLKCDAGAGADENLYDIDFNGIKFTDMVLYDYSISIEANAKILTVTFKDYSIILDKIYVGLLKRQGNVFTYTAPSILSFPVICPDCILAGDSLRQPSFAERDMAYCSYVGINEEIYDNFAGIHTQGGIYVQWEALFQKQMTPQKPIFDLNGGYLIIGTEEATEERCGDLAPVSYNFNQLLASLRIRGLQFVGAFPIGSKDADYFYHQNYIGSLREVLQQWCSDLGYDFYCMGKQFIGINLNRAIDISNITSVADPTTSLGADFAANQNTNIISYHSSSSLQNTFKQAVITANNRARNSKISSKSPKRYVGILPLHPIDFNRHSFSPVMRYDAFGNPFFDIAWQNNFEYPSFDRLLTLPELDGRTYGDVDSSIALTRFDSNLRDIFCQDLAIWGQTAAIRAANFRALGMVPLVELTDEDYPEAKAICIENLVGGGGGDEIQSVCLDKQFYKVYLGYYYPKYKEDITQWEQLAGDGMYRYGIVTRGLLNHYPYMPQDSLTDMSPTSGLYGSQGTSLLRISHTVEPACNQYFVLRQAPFEDLVLYSGIVNPNTMQPSVYGMPGIPAVPYRTGLFPTGLFYAELTNDWGTPQEDFKRYMSLALDDPCVNEYSQYPDYTSMVNNIPKKFQDWRLDYFVPKASHDLEKIWDYAAVALENLPNETLYDRTVNRYYDLHHKKSQACSKLHVLVLTDTRNHPNFNFACKPHGTQYINLPMLQNYFDREREAIKRRVQTKTPSICDISLLQEMCRNMLSGKFQTGPTGDSRYGCIQDEDKWNWLEDGFTYPQLTRPNSRGLQIRLIKNPISNTSADDLQRIFKATDVNGDFYYSDLVNNFLTEYPAEMTYTIVYPVGSTVVPYAGYNLPPIPQDPGNNAPVIFGLGGYYRGVLTSNVDIENRTPEIVEVYGSPVNSKNNVTSSLKVINNTVDPDLQPQLDPFSMRFWAYMTVITGDAQIITTVKQYHDFVKNLNNYELTTPWKTVDLQLAGSPANFGSFNSVITPNSGLTKFSMSVGDNGVITSLSFSDRPKVLPKQESILNKITPRMVIK